MTAQDPNRLRQPPRQRFEGPARAFALDEVFQELAAEPFRDIDGHHQITLFKDGHTTLIAFLFAAQGYLPEHRTEGIVTIQVLAGHLQLATGDGDFELRGGGLLVLRPGLAHSVEAKAPSRMLLTVHLGDPPSTS